MPKQSQSQRQSVVVNIGTSKTKSKPRKSRGRGGLPPPSYQHNLAPTFVTQQATDYTPIIGAIASLTAKLNEQPRIQNTVTPLSSTTSFSTQQAQAMAGQMAEERRDGPTAGNFQSLPSQADEILARETQDKLDVQAKQAFEQNVSGGGGQKIIGGGQHQSIEKLAPKSGESKRADGSKKQDDIYKVIKDKMDGGMELSAEELKKARSPTGKTRLGKKRQSKLQGTEGRQ